jgi:hypothetical protein
LGKDLWFAAPLQVHRDSRTYRVFKNEGVVNNSEFHRLASNGNATADYGNYGEIPNVAGTDYTQINKAPTPHININASLNGQAVRQIAICFLPNAVDGVDLADSKSADTELNLPFDMYFYLDNKEYIHTTTSFDIHKTFPVGFKITPKRHLKFRSLISSILMVPAMCSCTIRKRQLLRCQK